MVAPKRFIVKVQLPQFHFGIPMALVYNQTRTVEEMVPVTPQLTKAMTIEGPPEPKMFFWAHIDTKKVLYLDEPAPWQEW